MGLLTGILIFLAGAICGIGGLLVGIIYVLNVRTSKLEKTSTFPNLDPKNIPKEIPILAKPVTVDLGTFRTSDLNEIQRRKLICEIVEANDLFSLDQNGDLDTFVRIQLGSQQRLKTRIVTKTRKPKWNEKFVLAVDNPQDDKLNLQVYVAGKESIGEVSIGLSDLRKDETKDLWLPLTGKITTKFGRVNAKGEIHILLTLIDFNSDVELTIKTKKNKKDESFEERRKKEEQKKREKEQKKLKQLEKKRIDEQNKARKKEEKRIQKLQSEKFGEEMKRHHHEEKQTNKLEKKKGVDEESFSEEVSLTESPQSVSSSKSNRRSNSRKIIHQGWLDIRYGKQYENHWFILEGVHLKYFTSPPDTSGKGTSSIQLGTIDLTNARIRRSRKKKMHIVIKNANVTSITQFSASDVLQQQQPTLLTNSPLIRYKKLLLRCQSKSQYDTWIQHFEHNLHVSKQETKRQSMVRDTLPLIEGSTDSDSLSDTATANDDDEESTFQTQDEISLEENDDSSSKVESSMVNSDSDSDDESRSYLEKSQSGRDKGQFESSNTNVNNENMKNQSLVGENQQRRHKRHLGRILTVGGPHELPKSSQNTSSSQHSQMKFSRKSQSVDLSERKETLSRYSVDTKSKETKNDQQPVISTLPSQNNAESSAQITHARPRRTSSNPSSIQAPPQIVISSFDNNKKPTKLLTESQKNGIGGGTNSEGFVSDGEQALTYLETELQRDLDSSLPPHYSSLMNNVNFSQQSHQTDANSTPQLKNDEIFTSKSEPLIRVPESIPWNRSEWLNLLIGRIFREMQTCKVFLNEIEDKVRDALDQLPKRPYLGPIELHKFDFGNKQWDIKGVRCFKPFGNDSDELIAEADVLFGEKPGTGIGLHLSTEIYLNWPKPKTATIPITLYISITKLQGIIHFHFSSVLNTRAGICFVQPPILEFDMDLTVGNNVRISFARLRKFCFNLVRRSLVSILVYPSKLKVYIPLPGRHVDLILENPSRSPKPRLPANGRTKPTRKDKPDAKARKLTFGIFIDQILNHGKFEVIDEVIADDVLVHGMSLTGIVLKGKEAIKQFVIEMKSAFPDLVFYIEDLLADSVNVSCRWVARGTHKRQLWDYPPTNEEMLLRGMFLAKVKEGNQKITDLYIFWNISTVYSMV